MELISIEVFIEEHKKIVEKDKDYIYIGSEKRNKGKSKYTVWWVIVKHRYCNKISSIRIDGWKSESRPHRGSNRCCCGCYEKSFAYFLECELGVNLYDIWNWEENDKHNINPYFIDAFSKKKVSLLCLKNNNHNYNIKNEKIGYKIACEVFITKNNRDGGCGYCNPFASHKIHWSESLAIKYPNIAKSIAIKENNLSYDETYQIPPNNTNKYYTKCPSCNKISNRKRTPNQLVQGNKIYCEYCSDGFSIPEKFISNILTQLNIMYAREMSRKTFEWCENYRYDFYIPNLNTIIETHGLQHYEETSRGKTLEQEQENDRLKKELALDNGINNYIIIDCRYSEFDWLKQNAIKELNDYFDLLNIDWKLAWEESQSSLCIKAWELWDNGIRKKTEIANILRLNINTVVRYFNNRIEKNQ